MRTVPQTSALEKQFLERSWVIQVPHILKCPGHIPLKVPIVEFGLDVCVQMSRTKRRRYGLVRLG